MTKLFFLEASNGVPLTKSFSKNINGDLVKEPYPMVKNFISHETTINNIKNFYNEIVEHSKLGHCLLKGKLDEPLMNESRAGHTNPHDKSNWLVIDNDHLHDIEPQALLNILNLGDVDYIIQYSASAGIAPGKRGYHLFIMLDKEYSPSYIKDCLKKWNLDIPVVRENISLTRTNQALLWPIDITVCQNDKLIYIAPPIHDDAIEDTLGIERLELVQNKQRSICLSKLSLNSFSPLLENELTNQLRLAKNLPPKILNTRFVHGEDVAVNPDRAQGSSYKEERGFVYLNINGGDSFGYYHPTNAPEILYNFKGETNYLIREILPEYYPLAKRRANEIKANNNYNKKQEYITNQIALFENAEKAKERVFLAFRDRQTDQFYIGSHDYEQSCNEFHTTSSKQKASDYLVQQGQEDLELIQTWDYQFRPEKLNIFEPNKMFINQFNPSNYMKKASINSSAKIPANIQRLIEHVIGNDKELIEHFINWLACIFQYRQRNQTAWILQGTTGTGKGLLFNNIISPLIGKDHCRIVTLPNMEDQFNAFFEKCLVLFIDEVDTDQIRDMPKLIARLKNMITEEKISLRAMRVDLREAPNHLNIIMASNKPNSMRIEDNDRRFNVCPRQENKLLTGGENGADFIKNIQDELCEFSDYLKTYNTNRNIAGTSLENSAKKDLQRITQTAMEEVAEALLTGNINYFIENQPESNTEITSIFDDFTFKVSGTYKNIIEMARNHYNAGESHLLKHRDLYTLFEHLVGNMPRSKAKLSKRLGHVQIHVRPITTGTTSQRGFLVKWKDCNSDKKVK